MGKKSDVNDKHRAGELDINDLTPVDLGSVAPAPPQAAPPQRESLEAMAERMRALMRENRQPERMSLLLSTDDAERKGILPSGIVGMVAGAGGVGKSFWLTGLSIAVAAGLDRFLGFRIERKGRVLLALGEETADLAWRRVFYVSRELGLTPAQRDRMVENLTLLPMVGHETALLSAEGAASERFAEFKALLSAGPFVLVTFDPLAHFSGADVEGKNDLATKFIRVVNSLVEGPGNPTILVSHHTNKWSRAGKDAPTTLEGSASSARGSSGLTDGVRWQANILPTDDSELIRFSIVKNNYGPRPDELNLMRGEHGVLRIPSDAELKRLKAAPKQSTKPKETGEWNPGRSFGQGSYDNEGDDE